MSARRLGILFSFFFTILLFSSCAHVSSPKGERIYEVYAVEQEKEDRFIDLKYQNIEKKEPPKGGNKVIQYKIKPEKVNVYGRSRRGDITLHFDEITLYELLRYLAYEVLGFSYIAPPALNETVSVHVENVSQDEVLTLLREILRAYGYNVVVDYDRKLIKVFKGNVSPSVGDFGLLVYEVKYVNPQELKSLLEGLGRKDIKVSVIGNKVIVLGDRKELSTLRRYISYVDRLFGREKHIAFIKTSLEPKKVKDYVEKILALVGHSSRVKLIESLDDVGMIVVVTGDGEVLEQIKRWVGIIERSRTSSQERIYLLRLNYLKAEDVEEFLRRLNVFDTIQVEGSPLNGKTQLPDVKAEKKEERKEEVKKTQEGISEVQTKKKVKKPSGRIVADPSTNTLIIRATPLQYRIIESIVKELDTQPSQAFIEMVVAEVSLGDSLNYGLEALFKGLIDNYRFTVETTFGLRQNSAGLTGFKAIVFGRDADIRGILNFLASKTKLRVLSAPYILVKNREEAKIEVGAEVPIITELMTTTSGGVPVITTAVQYRATGIILRVKPIISEDGAITLKIEEEVSDAIPNTLSPEVQSPIITKRSATTTLVLKDGQVALLGGILQRRLEENQQGVPFLSDIPALGYLFKTKEKKSSKTELIILLKAHVVKNFSDISERRDDVINRLEGLKELIRVIKRKDD